MANSKPIILGPGEGSIVANPVAESVLFRLRADDTGGGVTLFESTAARGQGPPLQLPLASVLFERTTVQRPSADPTSI